MDFSANWKNWEFSDEDSIFTHSYAMSVSPQATSTINLGASFRYVGRHQGDATRETLTPTLSMGIANDLFDFNLSATQTERRNSDKPDITNRSWDANVTSDYKKLANIRLYVGQSFEKDDGYPRHLDADSLHYGFQISKEWRGLEVMYNYRGAKEKDRVELSTTRTDQHFLKGQYSGNWKKLSFTIGQQLSFPKTVIKTSSADGGNIRYPLPVDVAWNPPQPSNGKPLTRDQEIIIDLHGQPVDEIHFYINGTFLEEVPSSVRWDLYESHDSVTWEEIRTGITLPFRFPETTQNSRYLKLVVAEVPIPAPELENPVIRVYLIRPGTGHTDTLTVRSNSYRTNLSLGYTFSPDLMVNYYFSYDKNTPDPGNDSTNINHTLSASWQINRFFEPHANLSMTTKDTEGQGKTETTTLSLNNTSQIYETLQVITGFTHAFSKEEGKLTNTTDTFTVTSTANLYPDLDLRWNGNYSHARNYLSDSTTGGISSQVYMTARLSPKLTINGTYDISRTESSTSEEGAIIDHHFSIDASWRMSDDLSLKGSENITLSDNGEKTINSNYSVWVALTPKVQANVQYISSRNHSSSDNYSAFISWKVSPYLTLKSTYDRTVTDGEGQWAWMVNLIAYF